MRTIAGGIDVAVACLLERQPHVCKVVYWSGLEMQRRPECLTEKEFDVVVAGGGIYGACVAWEAVTRGLSVALVEKADFGGATSANMHRILHGGFRYLRNADVKRIRESVRERNAMMRLAPHLTGPLHFLVPTYRTGVQHKELMRLAIKLYDALSFDRNRGISDPGRRIPQGRIVSREECLRLAPGLDPVGVTGGAIWYDGQLSDPARLTLQFVRSAHEAGARPVNYTQAIGLLRRGARIAGLSVKDALSGEQFDVRGRMVVNCTGPWIQRLLSLPGSATPRRPVRYVRSVDVITRPLTLESHGLALMAPQHGAPDRIVRYFIAPWRGMSVLGSVDYLTDTDPDAFAIRPEEIEHLVNVMRQAMPGAAFTAKDVVGVQAGLIPHDDTEPLDDPYNAARHYRIVDHRRDGADGLVSVIGIKYTTARDVAEKTVDHIIERMGARRRPSRTREIPLHGGAIEIVDDYLRDAIARRPLSLDAKLIETLVRTYGSEYGELTALIKENPAWALPLGAGAPIVPAQIVYAVRHEMAQKLADVAVRRTNLATERHPGREGLQEAASVMGALLGWTADRVQAEVRETESYLSRFLMKPAEPSLPARG